ncbi:Signal peptidase I [Cystobacter fuscus DSM 2262]|uniref:Signal peptidase I n=1 Tax=Cystobacter fuscus (strain ATCC 25194 / DSM 2262 / NBRC 100088 / M29) TaxID=1242864 RepID=S9QVM5_CYSF2|nr:signal peptidase I [Cystobacter fuscus]EPX60708.1 Signal peptidase I [Cystobacter fuscus DSM 2262]
MTTISSPPVSRWRRLLAVLLSITPGCGHVLWGRWRRGLVWLGALLLAQASLPLTGFAGLLLGLGVILGAAVDVARLPPPEAGVPRLGRVLLTLVGFWMGSGIVASTSRRWLAEPFTMPSASMQPTLLPGDQFYTDKRVASPWGRPLERGEVIVFQHPAQREQRYVMRAVALAGEAVEVRCGRLSIDGQAVDSRPSSEESSCLDSMDFPTGDGCPEGMETRETGCVVPEGHVFLLGDNRDNSWDSRFWGPLPVENVVGAVRFIHFSWTPGEGVRWARLGTTVR